MIFAARILVACFAAFGVGCVAGAVVAWVEMRWERRRAIETAYSEGWSDGARAVYADPGRSPKEAA